MRTFVAKREDCMETFFQTHAYLIEQTNAPVRRALMDSIDWNYRMIGIKGPRGVGKTTFLLQYAKENFEPEQFLFPRTRLS